MDGVAESMLAGGAKAQPIGTIGKKSASNADHGTRCVGKRRGTWFPRLRSLGQPARFAFQVRLYRICRRMPYLVIGTWGRDCPHYSARFAKKTGILWIWA